MTKSENEKVEILMKNNMITKAKFNITTVQNRVFQLVMYKLQKKNLGVLEAQVSMQEFKKVVKHKESLTPAGISEILVDLRKQSIYFKKTKEEQTADKKAKKPFSIWGEWGIINGHEFDEETETFTIEASEKVHSYLHDYLEGGYTPVNLSVFFTLTNSYSQRFYDLLRLWTNSKKVITYSVDELKELLMIEGKYPRFVDFKRRVIKPAIEELEKTGMFKIEIKENRKGRAVESIDFIVDDLDDRVYFKNEVKVELPEVVPEAEDDSENNSHEPEITGGKEAVKTGETVIPEETCLIKPLHRLVKIAFKGIDFSEGAYYMAFVESEVATQIQDTVEEITLKEWAYFKATLQNKIEVIQREEEAFKKAKAIEKQLGY